MIGWLKRFFAKPTPRQLWVNALRSGDYKQCQGTLGGPEHGYCCLGVACDVYERETGERLPRRDGIYGAGALWDEFRPVQRWLGLRDPGGDYSDARLVSHNDIHDMSFPEIADIIESEPDGLFE